MVFLAFGSENRVFANTLTIHKHANTRICMSIRNEFGWAREIRKFELKLLFIVHVLVPASNFTHRRTALQWKIKLWFSLNLRFDASERAQE